MRFRAAAGFLLTACALAGCGGEPGEQPELAPPQLQRTPRKGAPAQAPEVPEGQVLGYVRVVGLDDKPLAGIRPIATEARNAFTEPVASGPPTGGDGRSHLYFPGDKQLFVRGWDPELAWFPNNFFQAVPDSGQVTSEMTLVMVRAAALTATLLYPDGRPVASENVGLMMFHPELGPWWPTQADTGPGGEVRFGPVPAGEFLLMVKAASGEQLEIPPVALPPGSEVDLGPVLLQ